MQLSVLCIDKKLKANFWHAFEKNLYYFKNNSQENRASIEGILRNRSIGVILTQVIC